MVLSCIVNNCFNYEGKKNVKVKFHSFPSDLARREYWLNVINKEVGLKVDVIKSSHAVCSDHFSIDSYVTNSTRLSKTAAPSIFNLNELNSPPVKKTRIEAGMQLE